MRYKFNVGDVVQIVSNFYGHLYNHCIGIISEIEDGGQEEETVYKLCIPEKDAYVHIPESELIKIPGALTAQQIKDDVNSIYGASSWFDIWANKNGYINEDIRRTQEMMDTVGKMIHEREERKMSMTPKKIMRNGPATIVFWEDGTKTVVKKMPGDKDDIYAAFCAAFTKKHFGSNEKVKAVVDSLAQPSEKEIKEIVDDFYNKHVDDFCKGYSVIAHIKDEKISKHFIEELSKRGFIVKKEQNCWLVERDDTKHIEWLLENKSFVANLVITLTYANGDSYRMGRIAENLVKDGYVITCDYSVVNGNPLVSFINKIEVNRE